MELSYTRVGVWGDQFVNARMKFGEEMRGVGGMDTHALATGVVE